MPFLGKKQPHTGTPSPAAVEMARLNKSEGAAQAFLSDLAELCGRRKAEPDEADTLSAQIREASLEANLDYEAVMGGEDPGALPKWVEKAKLLLAKLAAALPKRALRRMVERHGRFQPGTQAGPVPYAKLDLDAAQCLAWANEFFDVGDPGIETRIQLAACLLDFAFTRQGIDDDLVESVETKALPEERQAADRVLFNLHGGRFSPHRRGWEPVTGPWKHCKIRRHHVNFERGYEFAVHVDLWEDGIWQPVPDIDSAVRLADRTHSEHKRARALVRPDPKETVLQVDIGSATGISIAELSERFAVVFSRQLTADDPASELSPAESSQALARREEETAVATRALLLLVKTLRVMGVLFAAVVSWITSAFWIIPVAIVALLASWMLIDKKMLGAPTKAKALKAAEDGGEKEAAVFRYLDR